MQRSSEGFGVNTSSILTPGVRRQRCLLVAFWFLFVLLTDWNHRSRWQFAAAFVAWIIIAGQIAFAIYRPLAASLLYGIHYPMPPIHRSKMWNSKETLILLT